MTLHRGVSVKPNAAGGSVRITAGRIGGSVYAIDNQNVYKVNQNGDISNKQPRSKQILRDALETRAGIHK
ncbi:hypothetical protein [Xanthocytophaga agilis]|uniref:Uncharacterized protein n=1 Tax=Xanthocytophaga agilis TaxID=3048010 RepID=A0AAE3RAN2_9BACT|nr:hypothetical protein [Xanthocytophaga agilis]MDJ1506759.1 hypothetical protein [Xanthocytophaga agilis]